MYSLLPVIGSRSMKHRSECEIDHLHKTLLGSIYEMLCRILFDPTDAIGSSLSESGAWPSQRLDQGEFKGLCHPLAGNMAWCPFAKQHGISYRHAFQHRGWMRQNMCHERFMQVKLIKSSCMQYIEPACRHYLQWTILSRFTWKI